MCDCAVSRQTPAPLSLLGNLHHCLSSQGLCTHTHWCLHTHTHTQTNLRSRVALSATHHKAAHMSLLSLFIVNDDKLANQNLSLIKFVCGFVFRPLCNLVDECMLMGPSIQVSNVPSKFFSALCKFQVF